jgi:hypothetical protein
MIKLPSPLPNTIQTPNKNKKKITNVFPSGKTPRTSECTRLTDAVLQLHSGTPTFKKEKKRAVFSRPEAIRYGSVSSNRSIK